MLLRDAARSITENSTVFRNQFGVIFPDGQTSAAQQLAIRDKTAFGQSYRFASHFKHEKVTSIEFTPGSSTGLSSSCCFINERYFVGGDEGGSIYLGDLSTGSIATKTQVGKQIHCVRYNTESNILIAGGEEETCIAWKLDGSDPAKPWKQLFQLPLTEGDVWRVCNDSDLL